MVFSKKKSQEILYFYVKFKKSYKSDATMDILNTKFHWV